MTSSKNNTSRRTAPSGPAKAVEFRYPLTLYVKTVSFSNTHIKMVLQDGTKKSYLLKNFLVAEKMSRSKLIRVTVLAKGQWTLSTTIGEPERLNDSIVRYATSSGFLCIKEE